MRLLVLDGNSIINRAFYGVRPLTTKDGLPTNALFGFLNILNKLKETVQPEGIAVAFDVHAPTFRHKLYEGYKAGRKPMPDELRQQMPILKELLPLLGCAVVELAGYEADDILGTLSAACVAQGGECYIATGDRDALQLVDDHVTVLLATSRMGEAETVRYDAAAIKEKYGLSPAQMIDLKALMGDASDKIPGVPGVGEKTAVQLVQQFGSLDGLYEHATDPSIKPGVQKKLAEGKESAYLSRELGTICRTVPVETDMMAYVMRPVETQALAALLVRLEFFKMMEKMGLSAASVTVSAAAETASVLCEAEPETVFKAAETAKRIAVWPEFDGKSLYALWVAADGKAARYDAFTGELDRAVELLCNGEVCKVVHHGKPLYTALLEQGYTPAGFAFDTLLAAYLLNPLASDYGVMRLAQEYAIVGETEGEVPAELAVLMPLSQRLNEAIEEQELSALLNEVELPLSLVLADMERVGVAVDRDGIAAFGKQLAERIATLQQEIYGAVGYEFNLNSPKQLGKALFEDLGLPAKKKTKSGYSTNAEVLESLREAHPAVGMLLEYRMLSKLKSTYCDGLIAAVADDGRIHSSFNQTETRTGRISSTEPNLQNIPVRSELGREMRRFFGAEQGFVLCDADYSQIELRVLAHMSGDATMQSAFNHGDDIHSITAAQVFGVPENMVTSLMRSRAKAVNFGIVYGIGPHSLSEDIGVSYKEAKQYIDGYLAHYGSVASFMDHMVEEARENGYAKTLLGRRRPLPELTVGNAMTRAFGERVARNMPIQGTAADIIKVAMIRVYRRLQEEKMRSRLILQVHDELIVEAPLEEAEKAASLLREEMEASAQMAVKLSVDVNTGDTWYDAKG